jgi:hypothetical protein
MENLNVVQPSFITGGESVAAMMAQNNSLLSLDLSHNLIRGESAVALGKGLAHNNTLEYLNLSHNTLGIGAQYLAISLLSNQCLKDLDISYNGLDPKTAFVVAYILGSANCCIKYVRYEGNCIGSTGRSFFVRSLILAVAQNRKLSIDFIKDANENFIDPFVFDRLKPAGEYCLSLGNPYDYVVANTLLDIAQTRPYCNFLMCKCYNPPHTLSSAAKNISSSNKNIISSNNDEALNSPFQAKVMEDMLLHKEKINDAEESKNIIVMLLKKNQMSDEKTSLDNLQLVN